jgi:hypothetical protein
MNYEKIKNVVWHQWCTFMWAICHPYCLFFHHQPVMVQWGMGHKNTLKCENCGLWMEHKDCGIVVCVDGEPVEF